MSKELLGTFELECEGEIPQEKIASFFSSSKIKNFNSQKNQ